MAYEPQFDFSDFQSTNPTRPLPGHQLDVELWNISDDVTGLRTDLKKIQRSDGALNNGIVKFETLAPDVIPRLLVSQGGQTVAFATRADAVAAAAAGGLGGAAAVQTIFAEGLFYVREAGATVLADMPGWVPFGVTTFRHFGGGAAAPQAAINFGDVEDFTQISISQTLTVPAGRTLRCNLVWSGAVGGTVIDLAGTGCDVIAIVDGANIAATGILDTAGGNRVHRSIVKNIRSTTGVAQGIRGSSLIGSTYEDSEIINVESVGDGTSGNANGASRGILIQNSAALTEPYFVRRNKIRNIIGEEGDAIQVLLNNGATFFSSAGTEIVDNDIRGCSKRCIKIQADATIAVRNTCHLIIAGAYSAIDVIDGSRCIVDLNNVDASVTGARGIQVSRFALGSNPVRNRVNGNIVKTEAAASQLAIYVLNINECNVSQNQLHFGRCVIQGSTASVVAGNIGMGTLLSGSDGLVSFRSDCANCSASENEVLSGGTYTCVRTQAPGTMLTGNRNRATANAAASACLVQSDANMVIGNTNSRAAAQSIRYEGTTSGGQALDANNVTMA